MCGSKRTGSCYCFADVTNVGLDGFRYFKGTVALGRKTSTCGSKMTSLKRQKECHIFTNKERIKRKNNTHHLVILENIF